MSNLLKVNPSEYGIEESKQKELIGNLPQILSERDTLQPQYDEVMRLDIEQPETWKRAKELRKLVKDNRTKGIEVWHKTAKEYFLKGGQFVDAIKRKEVVINEQWEENMEKIEKHAEIKEAKRIAALQAEREKELAQYGVTGIPNLGALQDQVYENFLEGSKIKHAAILEAELKAEQERQAKIKAEAEERERIRLENERLKAEAEERELQMKAEREKAESERKAAEEAARIEREKLEAIARKEREEAEAKLKKEREERERIEAEIKAKAEAERKAKEAEALRIAAEEKAKAEAERKAKAAPDKEKLFNLAKSIGLVELPELKSDEAKKILSDVKIMLDKLSNFINEKTNQI